MEYPESITVNIDGMEVQLKLERYSSRKDDFTYYAYLDINGVRYHLEGVTPKKWLREYICLDSYGGEPGNPAPDDHGLVYSISPVMR